MVVCHCLRVTDGAIAASIERGCETVSDITDDCDAGGGCGRCRTLLERMLACAPAARRAA